MVLPVSGVERGPLLCCPILEQEEYCNPQREVEFWFSAITVLPAPLHSASHPPSLPGFSSESCLHSYEHGTDAPHWQLKHIQKDSAEPVGQKGMNASQYTASAIAHQEPDFTTLNAT